MLVPDSAMYEVKNRAVALEYTVRRESKIARLNVRGLNAGPPVVSAH